MYVNRLGLRNRDISEARQKGVKRVAVLGDSQTYGHSIRTEDLFSARMEALLNQGSTTPRFEVINAGLPGFSTAQELLLVRGLAQDGVVADLYVLMVFTNDILDNACLLYDGVQENRSQPGFTLGSDGAIVLTHPPEKPPEKDEERVGSRENPRHHVMIGSVLRQAAASCLQRRPGLLKVLRRFGLDVEPPRLPAMIIGWYTEGVLTEGVPLMKGIIREMRDEVRRHDSQLLVSLIPSEIQVYPDTYRPILMRGFPDSEIIDDWLQDPGRPQRILSGGCAGSCKSPFSTCCRLSLRTATGTFTSLGTVISPKRVMPL